MEKATTLCMDYLTIHCRGISHKRSSFFSAKSIHNLATFDPVDRRLVYSPSPWICQSVLPGFHVPLRWSDNIGVPAKFQLSTRSGKRAAFQFATLLR